MKPRRLSYRKAQTERVVRMKSFGTRDRDNEETNTVIIHIHTIRITKYTDSEIFHEQNEQRKVWKDLQL